MSSAKETAQIVVGGTGDAGPLPHDGMKSRSFWYGCAVTIAVMLGTAAAVAFGKAEFKEAAPFLQVIIPLLAAITLGKMWGDKKLEADVRKKA